MSLKTTVDRIIETYGREVILRTYTTTTNDYGEEINSSYVDFIMKGVSTGTYGSNFLREMFGLVETSNFSLLISSDISVNVETDKFVIDGKELVPKNIRVIYYKDESVLKVVDF